jgi:beta-D-xylosidase 4
VQLALFDAVAAKAKTLVVVIMAGGPVDVSPFKTDKRVSALIYLGYPGMQGGRALADALFGTSPPSGRLPFSIQSEESLQKVNVMDMRMRPNASEGYPGRTHRFSTVAPVYNFGAGMQNYGRARGLSYRWADASDGDDCTVDAVGVRRGSLKSYLLSFGSAKLAGYGAQRGPELASRSIIVRNDSPRSVPISVLAFLSPPGAGTEGRALRELLDFKKVWLAPGESRTLAFGVFARDVTLVDDAAERVAVTGGWTLRVEGLESTLCF